MTNEEIENKADKLYKIFVTYSKYLTPPEIPLIPKAPTRESLLLKHLTDDKDVSVIAYRIGSIIFQQAWQSMVALSNREACIEAVKELAEFQNATLYREWEDRQVEAERQAKLNDVD